MLKKERKSRGTFFVWISGSPIEVVIYIHFGNKAAVKLLNRVTSLYVLPYMTLYVAIIFCPHRAHRWW